jgi:rhodanese-related sulfurtransferase
MAATRTDKPEAAHAATPDAGERPAPKRPHRVPGNVRGLPARVHWIGRFVEFFHPAALHAALSERKHKLILIDARYPEAWSREHLPGAINIFCRSIDAKSTADLSRDAEYVVYCWNSSCRASTIAAERLESLGFRVHELHGGLQRWKHEGYPTERPDRA